MYHNYQVVPAPVPITTILAKMGHPTRLISRSEWFNRYEGSLPSTSSSSLSRYRVESRVLALNKGNQYLYFDLPYSDKPYLEGYLFSKDGRYYGSRSLLRSFVARCVGLDESVGVKFVRFELDTFIKGFVRDHPNLLKPEIIAFSTIYERYQLKRSVIDFSSIAEILDKSYSRHKNTLREISNSRRLTHNPYWGLIADSDGTLITGVPVLSEIDNRVFLYNTYRGIEFSSLLRGIDDKRSLDVVEDYYGLNGGRRRSIEEISNLLGLTPYRVEFILHDVWESVKKEIDAFASKV